MQCISPAAAAAAAPDHFGAIIVNYGLHFGGSFIHFVSRTDERASRLLRRSENAAPLPTSSKQRHARATRRRLPAHLSSLLFGGKQLPQLSVARGPNTTLSSQPLQLWSQLMRSGSILRDQKRRRNSRALRAREAASSEADLRSPVTPTRAARERAALERPSMFLGFFEDKESTTKRKCRH